MPAHRADGAAIDVDAERTAVAQGVGHLMDVACGRQQDFDLAWREHVAIAFDQHPVAASRPKRCDVSEPRSMPTSPHTW